MHSPHPQTDQRSVAIDFDPRDADLARLIDAWLPMTFTVNSINRSMGLPDLYPFVLSPRIIIKLVFVHEQIHPKRAARDDNGDVAPSSPASAAPSVERRSQKHGFLPPKRRWVTLFLSRRFSSVSSATPRRLVEQALAISQAAQGTKKLSYRIDRAVYLVADAADREINAWGGTSETLRHQMVQHDASEAPLC